MLRTIFRGLPLAAAALFAWSGAAHAVTAGDSYLCWAAKYGAIPVQPKYVGAEVHAIDQFTTRNYTLAKWNQICNPSLPAANDATAHLTEFTIKDSKVNTNPAKFVSPTTTFFLNDQFIGNLQFTIAKPKSLKLLSNKDNYGPKTKCKVNADCTIPAPGDVCVSGVCLPSASPPFPPTPAQNVDSFMCYTIKTPVKPVAPAATNVTLADEFGNTYGNYDIKKLTKVCAPVNVNGLSPTAPSDAVHLSCYTLGLTKVPVKPPKAPPFKVAATTIIPQSAYLDIGKQVEACFPALKSTSALTAPTKFDAQSQPALGSCGSITTNMVGEGVPKRKDPANPSADPNSVCTGAGAPKACCEGAGTGHCDERTSIVCGSLTFGGGGPSVGNPGGESVTAGGSVTRYDLNCGLPAKPAGVCTISGDPGNLPTGVQCSTAGCGGVTPVDTSSPVKVCAINKLAAPGNTGTLNLITGAVNLAGATNATVNILTSTSFPSHGCPRCRATTSTASAEKFSTGPTSPGIGVCDSDSANSGATCFVFEPAGSTQGLSADCNPVKSGVGTISIATTQSTGTSSVSDPAGHFCSGQAGNADCTANGVPQACCSGPGAGSCTNFNGCFGSANSTGAKYTDIPATCTGISSTGSPAGALTLAGPPAPAKYGATACIPGVNSGAPVLDGLVNNTAGLPGPVVTSSFVTIDVN